MNPEITIHRPRGLLPKVAVDNRTVVDYQPSWLLVGIPALVIWRARKRKSQQASRPPQEPSAELQDSVTTSSPRWRRSPRVPAFTGAGLRKRPVPAATSPGNHPETE